MKKQVFILCLLALIGTVSADNLFFKVVNGDSPGVNVTNAEIRVCVQGDGPFTSGGGTAGGGGGGGGAGGEGDTISVSPSTASNGCLTGTTDYLGEASFNIEYRGLNEMPLYYTVQASGYKNATGQFTMRLLESMLVEIQRPMLDLYPAEVGKWDISWENWMSLDLTEIFLLKNPFVLNSSKYLACPAGKICTYPTKNISVSMQYTGAVFHLRWGDIFPTCAADYSGNVNTARCASEFLVPNMHLQSMVSLTYQIFLSIFRIELSVKGLFDWILGILTPLLIMALIFIYEVVKTYLLFALTYLSWTTLISVLIRQNIISASVLAWLIPATIIAIFLGSVWLIGSDVNLWKPLIIW